MAEKGRSSFILSNEMRKYFGRIGGSWDSNKGNSKTGKFGALVEPFYFCMILGMSRGKKGKIQKMERDMVDYWAKPTQGSEMFISALSFYKHCNSRGLTSDEQDKRVLKEMKRFFSEESNVSFKAPAYKMMNQFAQHGFEVMKEEYPKPSDMADFISVYLGLIGDK